MAAFFADRRDAGALLAAMLGDDYKGRKGVVVLALPRGGVVTGREIAARLGCPLDVLIVRKLGFPGEPEVAIGAVSETGALFLDERVISSYGIARDYIDGEIAGQKATINRRMALYRNGRGPPGLKRKTAIFVDDGAATGATMKAAILSARAAGAGKVVVAVPVAAPNVAEELRRMADEFVCLETPPGFMAVGEYYGDFSEVTDDDVVRILRGAGD